MRPESWKQIKAILEEVLQLDKPVREVYLDELEIDGAVRAEVKSFLDAEEDAEQFLSAPAGSLSSGFLPDSESEANSNVGLQIGIYRIVRELGLGGMGAVYLAERTDGKFSQLVAVKMLKREYNTKRIRRSFARERDIQGGLKHPNIATLIDAGTSQDGIPYLIMEHVEGVPIDQYCRDHKLSLEQRLKLFNRACEAVSFAHRNLIVHRDLKPSNILVTEEGEPKLLDFGISKLLGEDGDESSTITNLGAMTPKYASPEQIRSAPITTATDIYSLGVVLFKILTGCHPFSHSSDNGGLLNAIVEEDPMVPSDAGQTGDPVETGEFIEPSLLKGDLDNILLKALRKEPERRYTTVEQLRDDIWRYLDRLPIKARPATLVYRARKFYSRNKIPALAGFLTLLGLIIGLTLALWQANVAKQQALIAESAQKRAELEARKSKSEEETAKEITRFMDKLISYANPASYAKGASVNGQARVIDAIDDMGKNIETAIPDRKDIQAELHHKFAEVYLMRFHFVNGNAARMTEQSKFHARRALELRKEHYGEKHELVAKDLYYLVSSGVPMEQSPPELLAEAIEMMRETNRENLNLGHMLVAYANRLNFVGTETEKAEYLKYAREPNKSDPIKLAERYYLEALKVFEKQHAGDHISIVRLKCRIAEILAHQGRIEELKPYYLSCSSLRELGERQVPVMSKFIKEIDRVIKEKDQ